MTDTEEHAEFEKWVIKNDEFQRPNLVRRRKNGVYENPYVQSKWLTWNARAQLKTVVV